MIQKGVYGFLGWGVEMSAAMQPTTNTMGIGGADNSQRLVGGRRSDG